jgi:hypothetical protein
MKSILKGAALLSAAVLIASCDSSSGGGSTVVTPAPAPQPSVTGTAVKGTIDGGTVTVTDNAGNVVGTGTVTLGVYDITYDADQSGGTLTPPLTVSVSGGTTTCDLDRPNTTNDCATGNAADPFATFGQVYSLPDDFVIRTVDTEITLGQANNTHSLTNLTYVSALASVAELADFSSSVFGVTESGYAGLVETLTGVSLGGQTLRDIGAADPTTTGASSASSEALAIAALNGAVLSLQQEGESFADLFDRISGFFTVDPETGVITGTGTDFATFTAALVEGLQTVAAATGNGAISNAVGSAESLVTFYTSIGNVTVTVLPQDGVVDPEDAVALTKTFVGTLGAVLGDVLETTGAAGFGGTENVAATEAFADELRAVELATSANATIALDQLDEALFDAAEAITDSQGTDAAITSFSNCAPGDADCTGTAEVAAADATETTPATDDGIAFTLTLNEDGSFTATGISSAWPIVATAPNQVVITADEATADGETSVSIPAVTMTSDVGTDLAQTFTGSYSSSITAAVEATDTTDASPETRDAALSGTIVTTETGASSFGVDFTLTDVVLDDDRDIDSGEYTASFSFQAAGSPSVTLAFNGDVGAQTQSYTITSTAGTVSGTVARPEGNSTDGSSSSDTVTITDGTAKLVLVLSQGNVTFPATLSVGETETGELQSTGIVEYTDDTVQALPAIVF